MTLREVRENVGNWAIPRILGIREHSLEIKKRNSLKCVKILKIAKNRKNRCNSWKVEEMLENPGKFWKMI